MKKTNTLAIMALALIAILMISGCSTQRNTPTQQETKEIIKIGWIGPQTGQSAVLGMDSYVAAQIAVDEINAKGGIDGRQLKLIIEDDQYDISKATTAYQKLVNVDGVKFILVNTYGSVFALAKNAEKDGVILIDPLDCNSELAGISENVFCLATDSESIAEVLAANAQKKSFDKVAILYWNNDLFMPLVKNVFEKNFKGEIVLSEAYTAGTKDFKTQISKIISKDADAIVLLGYDETGIAMKQARELGFKGQFYTTGTITSPPLQEAAQGNAEGAIFAFWDAKKTDEPSKTFTEKFIQKQGRPAILDLASYPTYDTVMVLASSIDNSNTLDTNSVKAELLKIQGYNGVTGIVNFAQDGSVRIRESAYLLGSKGSMSKVE